jgi:hypothetical protein
VLDAARILGMVPMWQVKLALGVVRELRVSIPMWAGALGGLGKGGGTEGTEHGSDEDGLVHSGFPIQESWSDSHTTSSRTVQLTHKRRNRIREGPGPIDCTLELGASRPFGGAQLGF